MKENNLKLIIAMARAHASLFSEIEKSLKKEGLNPSEFGVLELIHHKGKQPIQRVAERILVTSGTITYVIDKLIKKNYVFKRRCDQDKRIFYVDLTPDGKLYIEKIFQRHVAFLDHLLLDFPCEDKAQLTDQLFSLVNYINQKK
jgi:MarR family 2-MHQ and catechol resistance regulon transcriptional repressor